MLVLEKKYNSERTIYRASLYQALTQLYCHARERDEPYKLLECTFVY
jgi:hypothetical protein